MACMRMDSGSLWTVITMGDISSSSSTIRKRRGSASSSSSISSNVNNNSSSTYGGDRFQGSMSWLL